MLERFIGYDEESGRCGACKADTLWGDVPHDEDCVAVMKAKIYSLERSAEFHQVRMSALQKWQATIPDPYRIECCDILANGAVGHWRKREDAAKD